MQIEIISFTRQGNQLAQKIEKVLGTMWKNQGQIQCTCGKQMEVPLSQWCEEMFSKAQLLVFVGAVGIAVRSIAPFVKDKFTDPAVLVVDDKGNFVIPILSGHVGRANEYAVYLAEQLSSIPVITTATDVNGVFAVDVFARKNHLVIKDRVWAKEISAAVLAGEKITFFCEGNVVGNIPKELVRQDRKEKELISQNMEGTKHHISIGIHTSSQLIPKVVTLGMGCRKGKSEEEIEQFILEQLEQYHIAIESISCVASVDKKKEEPGILVFCEKYNVPFETFSPEELEQISGEFTESSFVKETIGVGNVCERAAVCAQNGKAAHVIVPKTAENGMTLAIAEQEWSVIFE